MFEGILESVLGKYLEKYIDNFNKDNLKLSVWSGKIMLQNVKLKKDIFQQFKLPLELVIGKMGLLKITVPWSALGSQPVDVLIEDILIVVKPITDQSSWQLADPNTSSETKEAYIHQAAMAIFNDLIKTPEQIAKEAGMMKSLVTKIIDNLQVQINNIHIRIENQDLEDSKSTFSLGVALKSMTFNTTDKQWQKQFIDRTLKENSDLPLYKILKIDNFGVYYKIGETNLIQNIEPAQQLQSLMTLSQTTGDKILTYENDYLIEPIKLEVKMEQFDPAQALAKVTSALTVNIQLHSVGICLQKAQYDNLQRLLELTNEYMCFCTTEALKQKKLDLKAMNETLLAEKHCIGVVTKRQVKDLFMKIYQTQFALVVKITLDDKKAEQLRVALLADLKAQGVHDIYRKVVAAIDQSDLNTWATQVCNKEAERYKAEQKKKQANSWGSYFWGSAATQEAKPEQDLLKKLEQEVDRQLQTEEAMANEFAATMQLVPKMRLNFQLLEFKLTLQNDKLSGVQTYSNGFSVALNMFDATNKYNRHTMEVDLVLDSFGVDIVKQNGTIPFLQQLHMNKHQALKMMVTLGNVQHQQSDLPPEQIDTTDLNLSLRLTPIEIVYQAAPIEALSKFFTVQNLKDYTKIQTQEQFAGLANSVNNISKSLEAELKNNKISIQVDAPCLVIPFKQDSQTLIDQSECWVFTMGDLFFSSESESKTVDLRFHEVFELKVQRVAFEYIPQYKLWKAKQVQTQYVLQNFNTSVSIIKKRDINQMRNQEMRQAYNNLKTPATEIKAAFDSNILLQLHPDIFLKLCKFGDLLVTEKQLDQFYIDRMNERLLNAHLTSFMKKENILMQWVSGTGCLLKPGTLFFYDDSDKTQEFEFSLDGVEKPDCCRIEGLEVCLTNSQLYQCKLQFPTMKQASRWHSELIYTAKEIQLIKRRILVSTDGLELEEDDQQRIESSEVIATEPAVVDSSLIFTFSSPQIQLQLLTDTQVQQQKWILYTFMEALTVKYQKTDTETCTDLKIKSLRVTDNAGDLRFKSIFENLPVEGQSELVSIVHKSLSKDSQQYQKDKVDSELTVSFGGLIVNWKPSCVINLVQFLNTQQSNNKSKDEEQSPVQTQAQLQQLIEEGRQTSFSMSESRQMPNCKQKPETLLKVNLKLSYMQCVFIHPENHTYPIFTLRLQSLQLGYSKMCDHDSITMTIDNFLILDNSQYPKTLNPFLKYAVEEPIVQSEIMGVSKVNTNKMLDLSMVLFTYPGAAGCCPEQPSKEYNMKMSMEMSQLKVVFMQEQTMRMLDYILCQVTGLISKNTKVVTEQDKAEDRFKIGKVQQWESFDLEQLEQGPDIKINIHSPVVVIPNLKDTTAFFVMDFGKISVSSTVLNEPGRWLSFPAKQMFTTVYTVQNRDMRFDYHNAEDVDTVWNEDSFDIKVTMVNPSPYFDLKNSLSDTFDFNQVDTSMQVQMELQVFKIILHQITLIALFDILANNVSFNDEYSQHFKLSLVTQADEKVEQPKAVTKSARKSMQISIFSSCLSLEMRDFDTSLIVETVIVGLEFTQTTYLNSSSQMKLDAKRMFMFHDEVIQSGMKQVMMGHMDAMADVFTNDDFYENMPLEFTKNESQSNFTFLQEYASNGDSKMQVQLSNVKMYLRQEVFIKMSKFLVLGLQRMVQKQSVEQREVKPSLASAVMFVKIQDTLMILENQDAGKRCIAVQLSMDIMMKSIDPKALKLELMPGKSRLYSQTKVDVTSLAAYFCDSEEIAENGYTIAEKRDILQPLECHLNWEINLKNDFPLRFLSTSVMNLETGDTILKLSIDDLHTIKAITDKQTADLAALGKVWADHGQKNQAPAVPIQSQDKMLSSMFVNSQLIEVLIINENEGAYMPLFYISLDSTNFTAQSDSEVNISGQFLQLNVRIDYFNPNTGCYEPVIERFPMMYKSTLQGKSSDLKISLVEPLAINVTADLALNIAVFNKLWAQSSVTQAKYKKKMEDVEKGKATMRKTQLKSKSSLMKSRASKLPFDRMQEQMTFKSQISHVPTKIHISVQQQIQKLASPYAIRNLTMHPIQVFTVDKMGMMQFDQAELVQPDEIVKLVQNCQDKAVRTGGSTSDMDLFVKLEFGDGRRPVKRLNLNKNNSMTFFHLYEGEREPYILQSFMEDNRRVLTVRSMFVLKNLTRAEYHVKIFYVEQEQLVVILDKRVQPGQSIPLPDHEDPQIRERVKIAIRPAKCKKWSQEFKLQRMKTKIDADVNVIWQHNETYSILRKVATNLQTAYDLILLPALIMKNCLPCKLFVGISGQSVGQSIRQFNTFTIEKEEEVQLQEMQKQQGDIAFNISLGDRFNPTQIALSPDAAKQEDITIKMTDKAGRPLSIMARVETARAGLYLVFFCENLLVSRASEQLAFYYSKREDGRMPTPIVNEPENVLIIFQNTKEIYAALEGQESDFSEKIQSAAAGHIGDFSVQNKVSKKQFNFAYSSRLWSVSKTEYVSTKIVEVAPQFILCNQTNQTLSFQQNTTNSVVVLQAGTREPYYWEDKSKPQQIRFFTETAAVSPCFGLKDVGTIIVSCLHIDSKQFFRVTKREYDESVFCVIEESQHPPYVIKNNLQGIDLRVKQENPHLQQELVRRKEQLKFAWSDFGVTDPQLEVEFYKDSQPLVLVEENRRLDKILLQQQSTLSKFSLDDLNERQTVVLLQNNNPLKVYVSTYRDTDYKVIEFADVPFDAEEIGIVEESKEGQRNKSGLILEGKDKATTTLEVAQISISCINRGIEVLTIFLHDLQIKQATTDTDSILESYLGRFQIDNNQELNTLYPVMMKPKCLEGEKQHDHWTMQSVDPVFQVYVHTKLQVPNISYYEIVEWLVKELEVKMELDHIYGIMEWVFAVQGNLNASLTTTSPIFLAARQNANDSIASINMDDRVQTWRDKQIDKTDENTVYIKSYKGSPFCLELSLFKQTATDDEPKKTVKQTPISGIVTNVTNMGIKLTSLNNAPIKLDALEITNVYGSQTDISTQLTSHYYGNIKLNIVRVLASSDLIGNPYNVVNSLGTGVKKFYYEPRNGFMEGPLQGGLGILKGTSGMVMITAASGIGSIGKMTNALNKGIVAVSLDKDYIHKKEINDIKNKPTGALSGVGEGVKGFGISVISGVTGVITKPYEGASKEGVTGFFKGVGKGILGLGFKPISGVVDLVSKTTQGIETSATGTPDCRQNSSRMRQPRPFYKDLSIVKAYNSMHAEIYNHLRNKLHVQSPFISAYKCGMGMIDSGDTQIATGAEILVVTAEQLLAIAPDMTIVWQAPFQTIKSVSFLTTQTQPKMILKYDKRGPQEREFAFTSYEEYLDCQENVQEIQNMLMKLDQ